MPPGSAERNGELWGARSDDWAAQEEQHRPIYAEAIRQARIGPGTRVLDVGCGSGVFLLTAAEAGAVVAGLDASSALAAIARGRVPGADVRVGDLQRLPHDDDAFDAVTGFNSFQFADDTVAALREARRVVRRDGTVVVQVWGEPERCDLAAIGPALAPLRAAPPTGGAGPFALARPGALEGLAAQAGLTPAATFAVVSAFEYADAETMLRSVLASGAGVDAIRHGGEERARTALREALAPFRTETGGYRLVNEWLVLLATA